jgi:hypothetical protein
MARMHTFEKIDEALAAVGWTYDSAGQEFRRRNRRVQYHKVLAIVPGLTLEELTRYVEPGSRRLLLNRPFD